MNRVDELDGEIRRALNELGDAAGPAPRFDQLEHQHNASSSSRSERRLLVLLGATALVVAGLVGLAVVDRDSAEISTEPRVAASIPTTPQSVPPTISSPAFPPPAASPLSEIVAPLVPDGFTVLYVGGPPQTAVAYDQSGVRLEMTVDMDADVDPGQLGDEFTDTADGKVSADGSTLLTAQGDLIRAVFSIAGCPCELAVLDDYRPLSSGIVTGLATALTPANRSEIGDFRSSPIGTADLRAAVSTITESSLDATIEGERVVGPEDFNVSVGAGPADSSDTSMLTVEAIRTGTARLVDDITDASTGTIVATRWVNDWQLVVTSLTGADQQPSFTTTQIEALIEQLSPLFADWTNTGPTQSGCATHTVVKGDSIMSIAQRYSITLDKLAAANADLETLLYPGVDILIPCSATPVGVSGDQTGLESFEHAIIPPDFSVSNTVRFATTDDSVYVISGGNDDQGGAILIDRINRTTGELEGSSQAPLQGCAGPVTISEDPVADPAAVSITCTPTGTKDTVDVFTSQTKSST